MGRPRKDAKKEPLVQINPNPAQVQQCTKQQADQEANTRENPIVVSTDTASVKTVSTPNAV